jgi:hypothetical protein
MRKDRLDNLYDRFTPDERFLLTLEALARGDEQEAERLSESCPRRTYTMNDVAYEDRMSAGPRITMAICLDLAPRLAKLRMIEAMRAIQPHVRTLWQNDADEAYFDGHQAGSHHAWRAAGMEGDPPGWEDWEEEEEPGEEAFDPTIESDLDNISSRVEETTTFVSEVLDRLERKVVAEVRAIWEAFTGFCEEELGFAPEMLLKAYFEPMLEQIEELKTLASKPDTPGPDPEVLAEYKETLSKLWIALLRSAA